MTENVQFTKSTLVRLLATENLIVEHRKVPTASFDLKNRKITLPMWQDITPEIQELLYGHEIGHAIDTPVEYIECHKAGGAEFGTFLNVVEDARIERMIKDRYPGLRKSFALGYRQFVERDFFEIKGKDVNKMLLIDRINLHFKIGAFANVQFNNAEENAFVQEIENAQTFDEVKSIATRLYDYCKGELEQRKQEAEQNAEAQRQRGDIDEEEDFGGFDEDDFDDYSDESGDDVENQNPEDFDPETDGEDSSSGFSNESYNNSDDEELSDYRGTVKSLTDESLAKSLSQLVEDRKIAIGVLPSQTKFQAKDYIVHWKQLQNKFFENDYYTDKDGYDNTLLNAFEQRNKNAINYLVKEFEMRKKATENRRITVADSGKLDTNKLHTYKFNDDIFRKIGSVAAGKNHGIVMFIDWSGSMTDNIEGTVEQLLTLTTFCRKVNIPFDVYAFTTHYTHQSQENRHSEMAGELAFYENFSLLNILSSSMKNASYRKFANDLLNYVRCYNPMNSRTYSYARRYHYVNIAHDMRLGGTPLNSTIKVAPSVINDFRKRTRTEIVNVSFITDGEDSSTLYTAITPDGTIERIGAPTRYDSSYIQDEDTKRNYKVGVSGVTPTLLQILKEKTGCNLIGFYILGKSKSVFSSAAQRFGIPSFKIDTELKVFRTQKFYQVSNYGYDQYFLIPGGSDLNTDDDSLEDILGEGAVSARKLKTAFLAMNRGRLTNRVLLSKVIEEIA